MLRSCIAIARTAPTVLASMLQTLARTRTRFTGHKVWRPMELMLRAFVHTSIRLITLAVFMALATLPALAEPTGIAEVNPRLVMLGTPFVVSITVTADPNIQVSKPSFPTLSGLTLSNPDLAQGSSLRTIQGIAQRTSSFAAEYIADEVGTYKIGPFSVRYGDREGISDTVSVPAVTVEVYEDAPRPSSGIFSAGSPAWWKYIITFLLLAVLAALVVWWLRLRKVFPASTPAMGLTVGKTQEQVALDQIRALSMPDADDPPAVKDYYDKIDEILRKYLGRRYSVSTRDLTTWEIRKEFSRRKRIDSRVTGVFEMINDCDWVKFAKSRPTQSEIKAIPDRAADTLVGAVPRAGTQGGQSV